MDSKRAPSLQMAMLELIRCDGHTCISLNSCRSRSILAIFLIRLWFQDRHLYSSSVLALRASIFITLFWRLYFQFGSQPRARTHTRARAGTVYCVFRTGVCVCVSKFLVWVDSTLVFYFLGRFNFCVVYYSVQSSVLSYSYGRVRTSLLHDLPSISAAENQEMNRSSGALSQMVFQLWSFTSVSLNSVLCSLLSTGISFFAFITGQRRSIRVNRVILANTLKREKVFNVLLSWFSGTPYIRTQQNRLHKMHR
jgi:hypothetical protein